MSEAMWMFIGGIILGFGSGLASGLVAGYLWGYSDKK